MSGVQPTASDTATPSTGLAVQWKRIVLVAAAVALLALMLAWLSTPHYQAETRLSLDADEEGVPGQIEIIRSADILNQVASTLGLSRLPEFDEALAPSLLSRTLVAAGLKSDPNELSQEERVLTALREKLTVHQARVARAVAIRFSSEDPKLAAQVPNAVADAYVSLQPDARILERALAPSKPYFPKIIPIVAAAFIASLLIMAGVTLLRDASGHSRRRAADIAQASATPTPSTSHAPATGPEKLAEEAEMTGFAEDFPSFDSAGPTHGLKQVESAGAAAADEAAYQERTREGSPLGEIDVESAAEKLIASGAARALFVSPEGDEAAASAVMVAREIADAGLRVLLLDLTAAGAASRPMLDSASYPGITNLLASEAQFTDVIHTDQYSDCHVMPVGTADPVRAMRAADRLPIIMESLTTAYDVVIVECGPADAEAIRRLVTHETEILVSVIEPDEKVRAAAEELKAAGYQDITLVTPADHHSPVSPLPGRSAA